MRAHRWIVTVAVALVAVFAFAPFASAAGTTAQLAAPGNLHVARNTAEAITLAWDEVADPGVYYEIYIDNQTYPRWMPTATDTIKRDDFRGLEPGTTHRFRVRAGDQAGDFSDFSSITVTWADGDVTPPTAPTNLHVVSETANGWNIAWDPSTDDSGKVFYTVTLAGPAGAYGSNVGDQLTAFVPKEDPIVGPIQSASVIANDSTGQNPSQSAVLNFTP